MTAHERLSLNRVAKPQIPLVEFFKFASELGMKSVEVRTDFTEKGILDGLPDGELKGGMKQYGIKVLSINALYPFEDGQQLQANVEKLRGLITEAKRIDCPFIVMCPYNEAKDPRTPAQRYEDLVKALTTYGPLFSEARMTGLIEPLGFERCALRTKRAAVDAIARCGSPGAFQLLHDTFHHYLAGETELFPQQTGLIHVSGVLAGKARPAITDDDRILVTKDDVMDTRGQVAALNKAGCTAPISYEPFSPSVRAMALPELKKELLSSVKYLLG